MVDAGGGAFARFGEAGARIEDLSLLAISHFHPDHVSDVPALLWTSNNFRTATLPFVGPSGNDVIPDAATFLNRLFSDEAGAFPPLSGTVGGRNRSVRLDVTTVDTDEPDPTMVFESDGLSVSSIGVPHGIPALAYRVEAGDVSIVFSSDQNGSDPRFVEFARDATVLVMHFAVSEASRSGIHARPSVVGQVARDANVEKLVLSHLIGIEPEDQRFSNFSAGDLEANVGVVRESYSGELVVAEDLLCIDVE